MLGAGQSCPFGLLAHRSITKGDFSEGRSGTHTVGRTELFPIAGPSLPRNSFLFDVREDRIPSLAFELVSLTDFHMQPEFSRVRTMPDVEHIRDEIERMRAQVHRQRGEIRQLQRSGIPTASTDRCSRSLASGPNTGATAAPSRSRYPDRTTCTAF
jgi:hypothetical protein